MQVQNDLLSEGSRFANEKCDWLVNMYDTKYLKKKSEYTSWIDSDFSISVIE